MKSLQKKQFFNQKNQQKIQSTQPKRLMIILNQPFQLMSRLKQTIKEVSHLMAMLIAINVIKGTYSYSRTPAMLKKQVDEQLATLGFVVNEDRSEEHTS